MKKVINTLAKAALILTVLWGFSGFLTNRTIEYRDKRIFLAAPPLSLEEALATIPAKYGLDPLVIKALSYKESKNQMEAQRHEPSHMNRAAKISKVRATQKMVASSHCALQVMGTTAHGMGVKWYDLYQVEVCIDTGSAYFAKMKETCAKKHKTRYSIIKCAARRYNGSGAAAEQYSKEYMEIFARLVIDGTARPDKPTSIKAAKAPKKPTRPARKARKIGKIG